MYIIKMLMIIAAICLMSCKGNKPDGSYDSIAGYDLSNPVIIHLKPELDEISGVKFYQKDSSVFAINDELGVLYKVFLKDKIIVKRWKFSGESDYEDLDLFNNRFYVLQSNGNINEIRFFSDDSVQENTIQYPHEGPNNFESLYFDDSLSKFVLICKNCASDDKRSISAYSFDPSDLSYSSQALYKINLDTISSLLKKESVKFKPSAAAINPVNKELYILSSVEKVLVIANKNGKIKEVIELNPKFFKQPEGISFSPSGDMYISNESAGVGAPTILVYKYKQNMHEKD